MKATFWIDGRKRGHKLRSAGDHKKIEKARKKIFPLDIRPGKLILNMWPLKL